MNQRNSAVLLLLWIWMVLRWIKEWIFQKEEIIAIIWTGQKIGDDEVRSLDEILRSYSALTTLDLSCESDGEMKRGKW